MLLLRNEFGDILAPEIVDALVEDLWERTGLCLTACRLAPRRACCRADASLAWRLRARLTGSEAYLPAVQLLSEFCRKAQLDGRMLGPGASATCT